MLCKIAFLDRDGVINRDTGYVHDPTAFEVLPGVVEAIKKLNNSGHYVHIVTNQAGIGRGYFTEKEYNRLTTWYLDYFNELGANIDGVSYCPHHIEAGIDRFRRDCKSRKPNPGMITRIIDHYGSVDFNQSFLVGDKVSDIEAGSRAGLKKLFLLRSTEILDDYKSKIPHKVKPDLLSVVNT